MAKGFCDNVAGSSEKKETHMGFWISNETFVPVKYLELKEPAFKVTENTDGSVSIQTDTFVPYCMLEGISEDTIWNENVVAFTDNEVITFVPAEGQKLSGDGIRIYDIYHTYH